MAFSQTVAPGQLKILRDIISYVPENSLLLRFFKASKKSGLKCWLSNGLKFICRSLQHMLLCIVTVMFVEQPWLHRSAKHSEKFSLDWPLESISCSVHLSIYVITCIQSETSKSSNLSLGVVNKLNVK